jgi:hypothetical protein
VSNWLAFSNSVSHALAVEWHFIDCWINNKHHCNPNGSGCTITGVLGESNRLTDNERATMIEIAVGIANSAGRDYPICVGTSHAGTAVRYVVHHICWYLHSYPLFFSGRQPFQSTILNLGNGHAVGLVPAAMVICCWTHAAHANISYGYLLMDTCSCKHKLWLFADGHLLARAQSADCRCHIFTC